MAKKPVLTSNSRVFIIEGRARPDHAPSYQSCLRMTGIDRGLGDITRIESPSPYKYGDFEEVARVRGAKDRATTSLEGRYALKFQSDLLRLARVGCSIDVQLHFGECQNPSSFNDFDKAIVLEDAYLTNYSTDDLGALSSDDNAVVNETVDISAGDVYEVLPISYAERAKNIITNEVVDVTLCDSASCGECETESDGCQKVIAVTKTAGGSPGTPADIVYTLDKGANWYAHDIDTMNTYDASAVDCVGDYVVVVTNSEGAIHYVPKSELDGTTDPSFTKVTTGFVSGANPRDISSVGLSAFVVGDSGYVYHLTDPSSGVEVLDAGAATVDTLLAVHALSEDVAVAVGNNGAVIYTLDKNTWAAAPSRPVGVGVNLNCVFVKSETEWWVGTSNGRIYYTLNGGTTWTEKSFTGSGSGAVYDIQFSTPSVGWFSHSTTTPRARIFRTIDGGHSWYVTPESSSAMPYSDRVNALATCSIDPNFVIGVGLADDGSDGYIVLGQAG